MHTHNFTNQKGLVPIIFLGILFFFIAAGFIGYSIFYANSLKSETETTEIFPIASPTPMRTLPPLPTPTPTPKPLREYIPISKIWDSGTMTYFGPHFDFKFDYPAYTNLTETVNLNESNKNLSQVYPEMAKNRKSIVSISTPWPQDIVGGKDDAKLQQKICNDRFSVSFIQYENPDKENLYQFIERTHQKYAGNGITSTFETYKKGLKEYALPKPGSYIYEGTVSENDTKEVYFEAGKHFYVSVLSVGCETGAEIPKEVDMFYTNMLQKLQFK